MPIIDSILAKLKHSPIPLNAEEIAREINKDFPHKPITSSLVRSRIRSNMTEIDTLETNPYTYQLKTGAPNLWVLKTVSDDVKSSQTDSYEDSLTEHYNYDNLVANSKQITKGDLAIIIDKEKILGFAKIGSIESSAGVKTIRRCTECTSTTIDRRKTKTPPFRCNNGHEFEKPVQEKKSVIKYQAKFASFISIGKFNNDLLQLKPFYTKGYNQNMSMQKLDILSLDLFKNIAEKLNIESLNQTTLSPLEGYIKNTEPYTPIEADEREVELRAIKLRRGQQDFRKKLLKNFNNTCAISGCQIIDILEAAHVNPYRGIKDNHLTNGILLRTDLHTLFDLNLIFINPDSLLVEISDLLSGTEYEQYSGISLEKFKGFISKDALRIKYGYSK